jgi:glucose-6-phosphate isomerase
MTLLDIDPADLLATVDLATGSLSGRPVQTRHLSDLADAFHDRAAYDAALQAGDRLVYTVCSVAPADGPGQMHVGLGVLHPGRVGDEYHLTKGHLHSVRHAAEVYVGLAGEGAMVLEDEQTGAAHLVRLAAGDVVYVPGHTAHRTVNTGAEPLAYLGIYPSDAGHDYAPIARRNFRHVVVERDGAAAFVERTAL